MGLTLRQLICSVIAIGAAVLAYLTLEPVLGRETASWVCIVAAVPIAAAGFFRYDDLNLRAILSCRHGKCAARQKLAAMENHSEFAKCKRQKEGEKI